MTGSIAFIMIGALCVLAILTIVLMVLVVKLEKKLRAFMVGGDAQSLEQVLATLSEKSAQTDHALSAHKEALEILDGRVKKSIRGYSLVRYNAYDTAGGEQSFASALIDEHSDGYILSVITNRNHVGVYAKKINRGTPEMTLTEEEEQSLKEAVKSLHV